MHITKNKGQMKTQNEILKATISNVEDQKQIASTLWFMAFEKLMKQGFSIDFSTSQATLIAERQMNQLIG